MAEIDENDDVLVSFPRDLDAFHVSRSDLDFHSSEYFIPRQRRRSDRNPTRINSSNPFLINMSQPQSQSQSRVFMGNDLIESDVRVRVSELNDDDLNSIEFDMDFESGLGFPVEIHDCNDDIGDDDDEDDCGIRSEAYIMGGISVNGSDSDIENEIIGCDDDEASLRLCWDAFQIEDDNDDDVRWDVAEHRHFEWEEVDGGGVDEREVLNVFFDAETENQATGDDLEWEVFLNFHNLEANPGNVEVNTINRYANVDDLEWEVFLNVHNLDESNEGLEDQFEDYNDAENEMLFGQFGDNGDTGLVRPPASKRAVDSLLNVVMTREDIESNNSLCAVCKDEIGVGEMAKRLPCSHHYHGECIVPWLRIRNTCPVCRHELPTDDPDYEHRKAERVASDI